METDYMEMRYVAVPRLLSFYALFMVAGVLTRCAIQLFLKCDDMLKQPIEEVVAAFEVYGCNIGHIYVFQIYGLSTHLVVLLIVGAFHAYFLKGITANPLTHVLQYRMNCCPLDVTFAKILAMVVGGLVGHFTAIACWPVLMAEFDRKILAEMHCVADSPSVPAIVSLGVEFLGTFLICVLVLNTFLSSSVDAFEPPMKFLITGLLSGTGMYANSVYLNPVVASRRLIGCDGNDFFLHLVNYWVAPIIGAAVAVSFTEFTSDNSDSQWQTPCCLESSKACAELQSDCDFSNDSDMACTPFCESQTSCLQRSRAGVDLESDCDFSRNSDLACGPFRECKTSGLQRSKACAELKSDFNPKLPCVRNRFHQAPRSRTLISKVQMPPIYISRAEEEEEEDEEEAVEDENSYNEIMYSCGKSSGVGTSNALNCDKQAAKIGSHRRCSEQSFDDACGRGFPGSSAAWQSSTVTSSRTCRMHNCCAPISCTGQTPCTNQPLCADVCTASDCTTVAYRCCCYMESLSCSCHRSAAPMPLSASVTCNKTDNKTSAFRASNDANATDSELQVASEKCLRSSLVPTQSECSYPTKTIAGVPPTCQRSQRTTFKQPLRDNSQIQRTDDSDELLARPSVHKMDVLCKPRESKPRESQLCESQLCEYKPRESKPRESQLCESKPRESQLCEYKPRESQLCEYKPRESQLCEYKPRESKPRECTPQVDEQPPQEEPPPSPTPSVHECTPAEVPKTSSPCVPTCHRDVSKRRSKPSPSCMRPKCSNKHHRKSPCPKKRKHSKCPSCGHRSSSRCGACATSRLDPAKPNHTPSHSNSRKLSPSGTKHRAPSCQRSRNTSRRRTSVKRSKPFPTGPESCMF